MFVPEQDMYGQHSPQSPPASVVKFTQFVGMFEQFTATPLFPPLFPVHTGHNEAS